MFWFTIFNFYIPVVVVNDHERHLCVDVAFLDVFNKAGCENYSFIVVINILEGILQLTELTGMYEYIVL